MPRHTLRQRQFNDGPQNFVIAAGDDVDTGTMSDCVSIIVMSHHNGARYTRADGMHGGGGIGNCDYVGIVNASVASGAAPANSLVLIVTGHNANREDYNSSNNRQIRAARTWIQGQGYRNIKTIHGWSGAIVDEQGTATKYA